jgi:hypothetical protein
VIRNRTTAGRSSSIRTSAQTRSQSASMNRVRRGNSTRPRNRPSLSKISYTTGVRRCLTGRFGSLDGASSVSGIRSEATGSQAPIRPAGGGAHPPEEHPDSVLLVCDGPRIAPLALDGGVSIGVEDFRDDPYLSGVDRSHVIERAC